MPGAKVEVARLDLGELATVRDFAARALDKGFPLDVLINNAGEQCCPSCILTMRLTVIIADAAQTLPMQVLCSARSVPYAHISCVTPWLQA